MTIAGTLPEVAPREEWLAAREDLLRKEQELTRARDRVNADRRRLPMVRIAEGHDDRRERAPALGAYHEGLRET